MIKIENYNTYNWENTIRGMRNPLNSWAKSDSVFSMFSDDFVIGENDLDLMRRLIKSGNEHRKFMRQIFVSCDITAPLYFWKEADQFKIGTTTNSCSTMHTIHKKPFEIDDFSHEHLNFTLDDGTELDWAEKSLLLTIDALNNARDLYLKTKDKNYWWLMIQLLPSSYNQMRTWTANYEVLYNIYHQRKNHKLDEWRDFCGWIETLPYAKELIIGDKND